MVIFELPHQKTTMSKSNFFIGQPVFNQLLNLIPRHLINSISDKHNSNRYCKSFYAYDHLVSMLYAGFFQCSSLRELSTGLQANAHRLKHLGLKTSPRRSTISDANKRRSAIFFEELYHELYKQHFVLSDSSIKSDKLFIIDSTTISLFSSIMQGAGTVGLNGKKKGGVKAHMLVNAEHDMPAFITITEAKEHDLTFLHKVHVPDGATVVMDKAYINHNQFKFWGERNIHWVTRQKKGAVVEQIVNLPLTEESFDLGVRKDELVRLGRPSNQKISPLILARSIHFFDESKQREFIFITNDMTSEPQIIAETYKRRWQIELLFKRIKQRYPLKYFLGDTPNAISIQIWTALICDLLVKIIQRKVNEIKTRPWAYTTISSMIKHHLMSYLKLIDFLTNPDKALLQYEPPDTQLKMF